MGATGASIEELNDSKSLGFEVNNFKKINKILNLERDSK